MRLLTRSDGVGFSVSEARASAGKYSDLWYKNHWEANYVRSGRGVLEDRSTGEQWPLEPGVLYCVGPTDRHRVTRDAGEGLRIISVFNPPIIGEETHDEDGAYPPTGEIPPGQPRMFVKTVEDVRNAGQELVLGDGTVTSTRYLTAADNLGFSLHGVRLRAGASLELWYKHHWEANLILDGSLDVTDHASGDTHRLDPGALYLVGPADRHRIATAGRRAPHQRVQSAADRKGESRQGRRLSADGTDSSRTGPRRRWLADVSRQRSPNPQRRRAPDIPGLMTDTPSARPRSRGHMSSFRHSGARSSASRA